MHSYRRRCADARSAAGSVRGRRALFGDLTSSSTTPRSADAASLEELSEERFDETLKTTVPVLPQAQRRADLKRGSADNQPAP